MNHLKKYNPPPGPFKSFLIHLAGAEPSIFQYLRSPGEATNFAKMGATVLIPFAIAVAAATYTAYTLMETKLLWKAWLFGIGWGLIIAIIDVAIMSQMMKPRERKKADDDSGPSLFKAKKPLHRKASFAERLFGRFGNLLVAGSRAVIAIVLGVIMSHTIVLGLFKNQVKQEIEAVRSDKREQFETEFGDLEELKRQKNRLRFVANQQTPSSRISAYEEYLAEFSGTPLETIDATISKPQEIEGVESFKDADLWKRWEVEEERLRTRYREQTDENYERLESAQDDLANLEADLKAAKDLRLAEIEGEKREGVIFLTSLFRSNLRDYTTGEIGVGTYADTIQEFIDETATVEIQEQRNRVEELEDRRDALETDYQKDISDIVARRTEALEKLESIEMQLLDTQQQAAIKENRRRMEAQEDAAAEIATKVAGEETQLSNQIENRQREYEIKMASVSGASYDLGEQTRALHELAWGSPHSDDADEHFQWYVLILMIGLMSVDLVPLLVKFFRRYSEYDAFLESMELGDFDWDGPSAQKKSAPGPRPSRDGGQSVAATPPDTGRRVPPPPRRKGR